MSSKETIKSGSINTRPKAAPAVVVWDEVRLFFDGDEFFKALLLEFDRAQKVIYIESYIFAMDRLGERVLAALGKARQRGVDVRVIVDGIGSGPWLHLLRQGCQRLGIQLKVFHESPWDRLSRGKRLGPKRLGVWRTLLRINNRNHRKVCIVDSLKAFVGSMNIIEYHSADLVGASAWRDTGAAVQGKEVSVLEESFNELWQRRRGRMSLARKLRRAISSGSLVRLNIKRSQRKDNYLDLLVRILGARDRIWIENAYFVPDGDLVKALGVAAEAGVDVRIVVPAASDVFFMPWVASAFHVGLLKAGARIFEYNKRMMHAKTLVLDDWGLVGSSNLNHRSLLHDLEADVVLGSVEAVRVLASQFELDCSNSREITLDNWSDRPWIERSVGRALLLMRGIL